MKGQESGSDKTTQKNTRKDLSRPMIDLLETMLSIGPLVKKYIVQPVSNEGDISFWQHVVLGSIVEWENISMSELAKEVNLSKQQLNATVRALEQRKFVERITRKSDRRFTDVKYTALGKKYLEQKRHRQVNLLAPVFSSLSDAQITEAREAAEAFRKVLTAL
jgi:DNA-binding MarR family transcriptional regulator